MFSEENSIEIILTLYNVEISKHIIVYSQEEVADLYWKYI